MRVMIYVVSGPSGGGKSTLIRRVLGSLPGLCFSVSHTTRRKRESEVEGRDYYFTSEEMFRKMLRRGEFLEHAVVHGHFYGTSTREIRKAAQGDIILDIDVQGARQVREKVKRALFIFVLPPSYQKLKSRLERRGLDSPAEIRRRLDRARQEIRSYSRFDYIIVNDDLEEAGRELESIIRCNRRQLVYCRKEIAPILESFRKKRAKRR
ncbi:MAG: guanylate kinase [Clostridiales bacterium]|nr:guanylate kinase [Clostridiales bacterium]